MNILVVSPSFPRTTWGAGIRNYYFLKALARDHRVSLLVLVDVAEIEIAEVRSLENSFVHKIHFVFRPSSRLKRIQQVLSILRGKAYSVQTHTHRDVQATLDELFYRDHYDLVFFQSVLIAGYRLPDDIKVVIDQHNIEHELLYRTYQHATGLLRRWYSRRESRLVKSFEIEHCRKAHLVLVTSEREMVSLKNLVPGCILRVVPNGVNTETFESEHTQQKEKKNIIFMGLMYYYPNVDAVKYFAEKCWPLIRSQVPDVTWSIVGSKPPAGIKQLAALPGVTVTGFVPDVRPYYDDAIVAIAPIQVGSGTRLKILEAMAMRKAVVSTSIGSEGLAVVSGEHLIIEDQPEAFAQAVVQLINDPESRNRLGNAGRTLVEAEYSWERCGDRLLRALEDIC